MDVLIDASGDWSVDFTPYLDITDGMGAQAMFFDEDGDATVAEPTQPPHIETSLTNDWIGLHVFIPGEVVEVTIVDGVVEVWSDDTVTIEGDGSAWIDGNEYDIDVVPGMFITATDIKLGITKELEVADLTIDIYFLDSDIVNGTGPANEWLMVVIGNEEDFWEMEVQAGPDGNWYADFGDPAGHNLNLEAYMLPSVWHSDEYNNSTVLDAEGPYYITYTGDTLGSTQK